MAARPPLCDVSELAAVLGTTDSDPRAVAAVRRASQAFRSDTERVVTRVADDVVTLDGHGGRWLHLPNAPVVSVASVTVDGVAVTDYETSSARGRLYRALGWGSKPDGVVVTYTHGYAEALDTSEADGGIPEDIREAVAERAEMVYNTRAGVQQYTTGGESVTSRVGATRQWMKAVDRYTLDGSKP